jgi:hypothetical protein
MLPIDGPTSVSYEFYIDVFRLSHLSLVIRDFHTFNSEQEVVSAARWRSTAEMMSPFDSPTQILYRRSVGILHCFSYRSKVVRVHSFGWIFGIPVAKIEVLGVLTRNVISYQRDPREVLTTHRVV